MSVTLSPSSQLGFQRPLTQLVKRTLSVSNHNQQAVAYKVKTTAPKQYCVRPNSGRIEPGETVEVQVLLQPMKEDPAPGAKCRDKFLVQSVIITPEREDVPLAELWALVDKEDKARPECEQSLFFEQKIRCAYLPAADAEAHASIPEETSSTLDASRASGMDSSFASTINQGAQQPSQPAGNSSGLSASPNPATTSTSPPPADSASAPVADKARDVAAAASGAAAGAAAAVGLGGVANAIERNAPIPSSGGPAYLSSSPAASPASKSTTAPTTTTTTTTSSTTSSSPATGSDEASRLRSELASAKAEIARLQKQLDASESTAATLRSRGAGAVDRSSKEATTAQAVVELKGQEGVPVQVVAGIAFGVFVVTWLFF
ncbi:PapD-like protein [Rhodotorula diobovata]|uniref:PapD-like protein n=1 Tax=Rhodotorula diobovata TaxID=5288 RepID=A0A5C5FR03_9BASI|nr:PapD-like protein [Rhodotorula diobovata]